MPPNSKVIATGTDPPFVSKEFGHPQHSDDKFVTPGSTLTPESKTGKDTPHSTSTAKNSTQTRPAEVNESTLTDDDEMAVDEHEALLVRHNIAHVLNMTELKPMYTQVIKNQVIYEIE